MQLVDLADEYGLTTAEALDLCAAAGIVADSSDAFLDDAQTAAWRDVADQQRAWQAQAAAAKQAARAAAEATRVQTSSFGPIPPAPWDDEGRSTQPRITTAPATNQPPPDLDARWGADAGQQVSLHAAAALALAVVSLIFPFVPAILAVPLAMWARTKIADSNGQLTGEGLAQAAIVVSIIGAVLWVVLIVVGLTR